VPRVEQSLSAEVQAGTDLLVVTARDSSSERSRAMVTSATSALVALAKRLDPPAAAIDGPTPTISIAQDPVTIQEPGTLVRDVGFSAVLGLLVGGVLVAVREATRKTVTEEDDLRRLGIGTVGVISLSGRWARSGQADSALAEAFRRLRSLLPETASLRRGPTRGTALLLTAANPKEGTTAVACGLAIAMAETGARVVLVDANLRSPGVGRYLAMDGGPGLADVLAGRAEVADVLRDPLDGRLTVLPPGEKRHDPGEVLASPKLAETVRELTARFDVVLVDAPPLHGVADATVLSKVTDGALLVVRADHTRTADVQRSTDLLEHVGARLIGAVLNALPRRLPTEPAAAPKQSRPVESQGLVTSLLGEREPEPPEHSEPATPPNPVSGRARVSETALATVDVAHSVITPGTVVTRAKEATANGHVIAHAAVRGQARVAENGDSAEGSTKSTDDDSAGEAEEKHE
jgi:capsular exopolysaccharide synthesis family protein